MEKPLRWRLGVLAAIALVLLALVPQAHLWRARGRAWHGAYASFDGDEAAYAAYLAALIEGRPRLNDPYTGIDDSNATPLSESLFSIQFIPAYALALPARALGVSASTIFIALSPVVAFSSALALFWLLALLLKDERLAACATIIILCLGTFASGQVNLSSLASLRASYAYLPFLRRYVPALPFPFLFLFCAFLWRALRCSTERRAAFTHATLAGAAFALLVYSYFYLWTTAAAWLACLALIWLAARKWRDDETRAPKVLLTTAALSCASLVPYALLLARRAAAMDKVQVLKFTHAPDLFRAPEMIALVALAVLAAGIGLRRLALRDATVLFAVSFALTPFVVFNQQIITGRSLQPVHYEDYVLNYLSLVALALAVALCIRRREENERTTRTPRYAAWIFLCVALASYGWAARELIATTRRFSSVNAARDEQARVASRLAELTQTTTANDPARARPVVFTDNFMLADNLPIFAPRASVFWSPHMHVNSGLTAEEHRERMYQFFYYTGVAPENFQAHLRANPFIIYKLFGAEHALPRLATDYAPLSDEELGRAARAYADYVAAFTRDEAARPALSFVITSNASSGDLSQLDRWYERDAGEPVANYTIYRVRLRP
ncbi:MAG TPA: hypothetical protein VJ842_17660 [Pyrinomonadaceae bacterium]|nr:hypothetical protein [Pyrinomonadaceae bacterium]